MLGHIAACILGQFRKPSRLKLYFLCPQAQVTALFNAIGAYPDPNTNDTAVGYLVNCDSVATLPVLNIYIAGINYPLKGSQYVITVGLQASQPDPTSHNRRIGAGVRRDVHGLAPSCRQGC